MIRIRDTLGGDPVEFNYCETLDDRIEMVRFAERHKSLGIDTESTGINPYRRGWQLRTFQIGNADTAYVLPARWRSRIATIIRLPVNWIGHNGPHDMRSIDVWLGEPTGVVCAGETYIPAHHSDSRKQEDGGIPHGLKDQCEAHIASDAGKWEQALKKAFKEIRVPLPGQVYKSGPRKGQPKSRAAHLSEGWTLIDPTHPAYIAYAGADPILTYRLWRFFQGMVRQNVELYRFDKRIQEIGDTLTRRGMRLDVDYTERLGHAYVKKANQFKHTAEGYGCFNINSGVQVAETLLRLGAQLKERTPKGQWKTDDGVLRDLAKSCPIAAVKDFIHAVLGAKQMLKRRENYTEAMLREMDADGRVHASINTLAARTTRMSVSNPALQQLPTKDREEDAE